MTAFREEIIGPCRLILGDCLEVLPTLSKVDAVITDPPYKLKHVDGGGFAAARQFYAGGKLDGLDDFDFDKYAPAMAAASDQLVAFHSRDQIADYANLSKSEFGNYDLHVWYKTNAIPFTCNTWKSDLEYIAIAWRVKSHQPVEQDEKSKAWISSLCTDRHHPTCKPVPLMEKYVRILVKPLGTIIDPFMGSGTTGVACIRTGRQFIGIEKEPKYFEIACNRIRRAWQDKCSELPFEKPAPLIQKTLI